MKHDSAENRPPGVVILHVVKPRFSKTEARQSYAIVHVNSHKNCALEGTC